MINVATHPSAVGVRVLGSRIPIMDACFCGFIRGVVLYADFTSERPPYFHAYAHGRADARFHLGAFRSEIPPIPTPTPGPSCVKTYVGAWSDTPRRGRPALYRGKRGCAISLWNAPRRSPAHPQTHGGNTVGSRSAQGDGPSVGPLIGPSVGAVIGPSVGIYGRGRRPRRPAPGAERPTAGSGA